MSFVDESLGVQSQLRGSLYAGVEALSGSQTVTFVKYIRTVLPLDGYVFWVRADLLAQSALQNISNYNRFLFNQARYVITGAPRFAAKGSLHFATALQQEADEGFSLKQVTFTSEGPVNDLGSVSPMVMYIAEIGGTSYAFSRRESFYQQADLYHYVGDAVYPALETQIINSTQGFDTNDIIVSNSLPIWLSLNQFFPVFPSYLVPYNFPPPYAAVDILEGSPRSLQAAPLIDRESNHWQLVSDKVRVTIFGTRNFNALDYQDYILQQSLSDVFGLMNMPVIRDEKRKQSEMGIIAQKKSIEFDISYYQVRIRDIARQLILTAIPTFSFSPATPMISFVQNTPLGYEGPFVAGEYLPRILFLNTTVVAYGTAYTATPGNFVIEFTDPAGNVQITVTGIPGNNYPQVVYTNGPISLYINQWLWPQVISSDGSTTDLAITLGANVTTNY